MAKKVIECLDHYFHGLGYNCAESTLRAANEAWDLNLPEEAFRLMGGFGGGMGVKGVCGGVSGGVAALSHYYVRISGHQSPLLMAKAKIFQELVAERLGDINCSHLMPKYLTEKESCMPTISLIAQILDEVKDMELDVPEYLPRKLRILQFMDALKGNCLRIDIRPNSEYAEGHIEGVLSLPLNELDGYNGDTSLPIVICSSDINAVDKAHKILAGKGFAEIYYFDLNMWKGELVK
ncbi:MAG: C-GCAxxG-C-C family protein [Clostridia bacterium]|nr:C-GCAxxG-C-C family protein [Clostridia bacterium]